MRAGFFAHCFGRFDGGPRSPRALSKQWVATVGAYALPDVTLHALRHTHAAALIAAGIDIMTLSRRLGHGSPAVTLHIDGHLFSDRDDKPADAIGAALGRKPSADGR